MFSFFLFFFYFFFFRSYGDALVKVGLARAGVVCERDVAIVHRQVGVVGRDVLRMKLVKGVVDKKVTDRALKLDLRLAAGPANAVVA